MLYCENFPLGGLSGGKGEDFELLSLGGAVVVVAADVTGGGAVVSGVCVDEVLVVVVTDVAGIVIELLAVLVAGLVVRVTLNLRTSICLD